MPGHRLILRPMSKPGGAIQHAEFLHALIIHLQCATSGAAGNGLGATMKYLRRTTSAAANNGMSTTIIPPCRVASFEVNSEPHTGARPSVRLCLGLELARCVHQELCGCGAYFCSFSGLTGSLRAYFWQWLYFWPDRRPFDARLPPPPPRGWPC
jgi:hypothetical protein